MKFLCDRCKTKYSIADEKVRRKILKIRCKNCTNIITVRDPEASIRSMSASGAHKRQESALSSALSSSFQNEEPTEIAGGLPEFRPEAMQLEEEWYYATSGQQEGPVPFGTLALMVEGAQVREDSFIWREGFEDWMRADAVPELRPFFKKKLGAAAASGRAQARREVPRPSEGKLAGTKTPAAGVAAVAALSALTAGGGKADEKKGGAGAVVAQPVFDIPEEQLPDFSDALETDDSEDEPAAAQAGSLGESVSEAVSGLFASEAAEAGQAAQKENGAAGHSEEHDNGAEEHSNGAGLDLKISEPSRIVKLDAILAAGAAARAGTKPVGKQTGEVFRLPGLSDDAAAEAVATITQTGARPKLDTPYPASPLLLPAHRDHRLYKMLAIGGGLVSLLLLVVVLLLLRPGGGMKTIVIEREKSPEDIGAEFAEQIAREEANKKFGPVTSKRSVDLIPPAHGAGGPPPRRSTMPPQPPHKLASTGKDEQRLAELYGGGSGPNHAQVPSPSHASEDTLEPFKRGAKLCLDRALKKDPSLQSVKIDVKISIGALGAVQNVSIPSPYREQFVGQCLSGVIKHLPWPSRGNSYDIDMPLLLSGG